MKLRLLISIFFVVAASSSALARTPETLERYKEPLATLHTPAKGFPAEKVVGFGKDGERMYVRLENGKLFYYESESWHETPDFPATLLSEGPRVTGPSGYVFEAIDGTGIKITGAGGTRTISVADGLPFIDLQFLAYSDRELFIATKTHGIVRYTLTNQEWYIYRAHRWLPSDEVTAIFIDGDTLWVGTTHGLSSIKFAEVTLEEKMLAYHRRVYKRHDRMGYTAEAYFQNPYDYSAHMNTDSDNDGLWTSMYCASECYRYAVTGSAEARSKAKYHLDAILRLHDIVPLPGFFARSIQTYDPNARGNGGEWHKVDGEELWWKGDTSSDEADGHFMIMGVYYDLVADADEKKRIAEYCARVMRKIIADEYFLVDIDGKPTSWGHWNPNELRFDPNWITARGLQSLEILSYLSTAHRICSEQFGTNEFLDAYNHLAGIGYHRWTLLARAMNLPGSINHSDDELAFMAYLALMRHPAIAADHQSNFNSSIDRYFRLEKPEKNPLWNFIYALARPEIDDIALYDSIWTLQRTPMDLRDWKMTNSDRLDIELVNYDDRHGERQASIVIAPECRRTMKYNSNPFTVDSNGSGRQEDEGAFLPFAYWVGRYIGAIEERHPPREEAVAMFCGAIGIECE
ncbi:MAG: hypothetical protein NUW37_20185 [Planctomycetes bacterium]|nr:hypothetical protein [Planctomycetota bacterium]